MHMPRVILHGDPETGAIDRIEFETTGPYVARVRDGDVPAAIATIAAEIIEGLTQAWTEYRSGARRGSFRLDDERSKS